MENGIPSHDTFGNVFSVIDTEQLSACFSRWVADLSTLTVGEIIAIDGQCLRGSLDTASNKSAIYRVSAWASQNPLVLGQQKVGDQSNEITAIPKLLERLDITSSVVTLDAMGCQTEIAKDIRERKADDVLSLKGHQGTLHEDVNTFFEAESTSPPVAHESYHGEHGRYEKRSIRASSSINWLTQRHPKWVGLNRIIAVTAERETNNKTTQETRYFISRLDATDPQRLGPIVRAHWGIENNRHWVLDGAFDEDGQRQRKGHSAANRAIVRHRALNLLNSEKTSKVGIQNKCLKAAWDEHYLLKVLTAQSNPS